MKIARTSKRNGCQVCGGQDSKCGWLPDSNIHFCMNINDAISAPPGWKYRGETRNGLWGMFVPDTGKQYTEEEIAAYKQRKIEEELRRRLQHNESLSEASRHNQLTKLINQLPLNQCHCEDLKRRNLSDELIKRGNFRSLDQFQKLDFEISHNLAGASINGRSLTNRVSGYMVPIWNEHGQMIGYQIRNDNSSDEAPKYIWATSKTNVRRKVTVSSHLQNGELPLTFCVPFWDKGNNCDAVKLRQPIERTLSGFINIAEGILKPWIISQLRELLVIGASGGNFVASTLTFKRYLDAASSMLNGTKRVVLWADAGAIANKHVMRQYRNTYYLLRKWGYTLQIAWWGQVDKNCLDGDEHLGDYELITWYEFESMARHPKRFWDDVEKEIARIKRALRRKPFLRREQGQEEVFTTPHSLLSTPFFYVPGLLPTYGEYVEMGCPKIIYKNDERVTVWKEAVLKGWSHMLDSSAPGLGKSYTVGSMTAEYLLVKQLIYLASDHRNPTTITIERNYIDVFPRHSGLEKDPTRLTSDGKQFLIHGESSRKGGFPSGGGLANPQGDGTSGRERIVANCARQKLFAIARKKNLDLEGSDKNICQGCNLYNLCKQGSGDNFGYLSQRSEALKNPQIRMHPDSAPLPINHEYEHVGVVWDEVSVLMRTKKKIEVRNNDVLQALGALVAAINETKLAGYEFDASTSISPLLIMAHVLLKLFELPLSQLGRYGLDDNDIRSRLGVAPSETWQEIANLLDNPPNLDFLVQKSDSIDTSKLSKVEKRGVGKFNRLLGINHNEEAEEKLESLPLNWLVPFLEVWAGYVPGWFAFNNGVLTIHVYDGRHRDIARAAAFNIYLDGTSNIENLSLKLGVPREHILHLETETPDYSNLEIVHIRDMGVLGRDRRESQLSRVEALREAIVKLEHSKVNNADVKVGVIERKAFAREGDGYHFRDGRGINRFSDVNALIGIGAPYANIGEMKAEYSILMKDEYVRKKGELNCNTKVLFSLLCYMTTIDVASLIKPSRGYSEQEYIDGLVGAEILQEIGRLRSHLRKDESLTYYFVGEYELAPIVAQLPGVKYESREAVEVSPYAAGGEQRTIMMVKNAIGNLVRCGMLCPTQKQVEAELEAHSPIKVKQARLSQLGKLFGGWRLLVELVRNALLGVKGEPCTENTFDDEEWIRDAYMPAIGETAKTDPVEAVRELVGIASVHGWERFRQCMSQVSHELQQQFVDLMVWLYSLFDIDDVEELMMLAEGSE
ncbi:hypothetical protein CAL7716_100710 (plasmid) [Calothrix sp. PCC 7716]|nr:hypothetical protein CAL7716_100710 [Calothrix sp. PCC 7716]